MRNSFISAIGVLALIGAGCAADTSPGQETTPPGDASPSPATGSPSPGVPPTNADVTGAVATTTWRNTLVVFTDGECVARVPPIPGLDDPAPGTSPAAGSPSPTAASPSPTAASPSPGDESPAPTGESPSPTTEPSPDTEPEREPPPLVLELTFQTATVVGELPDPAATDTPGAASPSPGSESPGATSPSPGAISPSPAASPAPPAAMDEALRIRLELATMPEGLELPGGYPIILMTTPPWLIESGSVMVNVDDDRLDAEFVTGYLLPNVASGYVTVNTADERLAFNYLCPTIQFTNIDEGAEEDESPAVEPSPTGSATGEPAVEPTPTTSP